MADIVPVNEGTQAANRPKVKDLTKEQRQVDTSRIYHQMPP